MRYPADQKEQTRRKILEAASRLFREKGYNGVGVDQVMAEAGLTAGGFYSHFHSKEALFSESIAYILEIRESESSSTLHGKSSRPDEAKSADLHLLIKSYLSRTHRDMIADGCVLPSLTPDVVRGSEDARADFERLLLKILESVESKMTGETDDRRERALAVLAQLVGGLMLSRAVNDRKLSDQMLLASRRGATHICGVDGPPDQRPQIETVRHQPHSISPKEYPNERPEQNRRSNKQRQ